MAIWYKSLFQKTAKKDKVVIVDFDGTIAGDKYPDIGKPMPGVKEALGKLRDSGLEIVIYTCRLTRHDGRPESEIKEQKAKIEKWLKENEVPYSRIEEGTSGKPHALYYIDNKALHYGGDDDWESIAKYILSKES